MKNMVSVFTLSYYEIRRTLFLERFITRCIASFEGVETAGWNHDNLAAALADIKDILASTSKEVMTPLRHAVTGMKVGSANTKLAWIFKFHMGRLP